MRVEREGRDGSKSHVADGMQNDIIEWMHQESLFIAATESVFLKIRLWVLFPEM